MLYVNSHWLNQREVGIVRLSGWGVVYRAIYHHHGPRPTPYSSQPFAHARLDAAAIGRQIDMSQLVTEALEVDEMLQGIRQAEGENYYSAAFIRYVYRLTAEEQYATWRLASGLGRTRYKETLRAVERKIGMLLGVSSGFG